MANASIKAQIIAQLDGFGNKRQKYPTEHFRSSGLSLSPNGMSASLKITKWVDSIVADYPQLATFSPILHWSSGFGRDIGASAGTDPMLYMLNETGEILQSAGGTGTVQMVHPDFNGSHFGPGQKGGLITDQKNRLLYCGERYLGKFDPSVSKTSITFTATNASNGITSVAGVSLVAGTHEKKFILYSYNGDYYFWRINTVTSTSTATMYGNFAFPTGTYVAYIMTDWDDYFKDFGSALPDSTSEGSTIPLYIPTETYEDTVLFMRANKITTLNTLTDSITTDSTPAFTLPSGFDPVAIHRGTNGILMGYNFQRKGMLVLWDNYSDRSIAPWIPLPDRLISLCKYNGGWIVITAREIYITNGYSLELLATGMLDMDIQPLTAQPLPQTSVTRENHLYFIGDFSQNGKRRAGVYRFNLESKLLEFIPRENMDQYNPLLRALHYDSGNGTGRLFVSAGSTISYVTKDVEPAVATLITNPVGIGVDKKHAEAVKLDIGVIPTHYVADSPLTFTATVKICAMREQIFNYALVKVTQTVANQITVDETVYETASIGDEIEFLDGNNGGYSRNVTAITGAGTATAVYTLDRVLPAMSSANDHIFRTKFKLVSSKTFTNVTEIDPDLLWFEIKNKVKGKRYMIKIDIEGATIPVELRPLQFIYNDLGVI